MNCPSCNTTLAMTERNGVEIDYCPNCRGVWLDRGELDKILERTGEHYSNKQHWDDDQNKYGESWKRSDDDKYRQQGGQGHYPHKKKKSFLSDFLDFD
ncbi:MAG: zf-TFIIB domain-containing protein [Phycisphaerae bacterium]|nr:zf-TFIIB domain-containing protein [Saprospiraceae bacterium]